MELKYKKKKGDLKDERFTIPVTEAMKADLEEILDRGVLVHDHTREYLQMLIDKAKNQKNVG